MTPDGYYFGTRLAVRCDYYAFPRTGSHYLWACLTGLLDLVFFPNEHVENPEARQRVEELNPYAYYAMRLREDGVPVQPVYLNASAQGLHGLPTLGEWPLIVLIRDPHAAVYSWYHTAVDRWGAKVDDRVAWIREAYTKYREFYDRALDIQRRAPERLHLVRFEELRADAAVLQRLVDFLGVRPKLDPKFVHWWNDFQRITVPGPRTFYRGGDNVRWQQDAGWLKDLALAAPGNFDAYGYASA